MNNKNMYICNRRDTGPQMHANNYMIDISLSTESLTDQTTKQ